MPSICLESEKGKQASELVSKSRGVDYRELCQHKPCKSIEVLKPICIKELLKHNLLTMEKSYRQRIGRKRHFL